MSDRENGKDGLARDGIAHGVPRVAVSTASTRVNKTGSWKYIRPEYRDRVAPCNQGCPVGVDIEGWMVLAKEGRLEEARALLLRENPLPAVTGRVCYHPCEAACSRAQFDEAVAIHAVERMLGDLALDDPLPRAERTRDERVAVVGSGPAGLGCAYHLARMGYGVTVFESEPEPGGILRYGIPEYRLPKDVLEGEIDRIRALGVAIECGVRVGRDFPFEELGEFDAVFVATGVHRSRRMGIPGEELPGVRRGLDFLRDVNRGRRPEVGRRVVVVGGGNTAMDCARTAVRLGAEVTVLFRRGRAEMPANHEEVEQALHEGVRFGFLAAPVSVLPAGGAPSREALDAIEAMFEGPHGAAPPTGIDGVTCVRMALGEPDESGRRRPEPVEGTEFFVPADTVLTALGEEADVDYLPDDVRPPDGVLRVNPLGGSGRALLFAGGDLTDEPHTVAYALGSGKRAAIGIDWTLRMRAGEVTNGVDLGELRWGGEGNLSVTRWREDDPVRRVNALNEVVRPEQINPAHFVAVARRPERMRPAHERRHDFGEVNRGLGRDGVLAEVERCFNCGVCNSCEVCLIFCPDVAISRRDDGRFDIAYDYCKGCGLCAAECPRGAITMVGEGA